MPLVVSPQLEISDDELQERFVRASGPGGQHVNKTSTAVELRFNIRATEALQEGAKRRLETLAGRRLTQDGVIVIFAQEGRSQEFNRIAARERLAELIRKALHTPKHRLPTKPTYASKLRRLDTKAKRGGVKSLRSRPPAD